MAIYNYSGTEIGASASSLTERDYFCSFSLFESIGVVGDSYANGYCGESASDSSGVNHPSVSWPQILARRNGVSVTNYAWGGQLTRSWITDTSVGLPKLESDAAKGLYILALERNDYNRENNGTSGYLGSISDIENYSLGSYPDTFFGNYATIIERIQAHAPSAKLVMMIGDYSTSNALGTSYNDAMKAIANHYQIPYMEQMSDDYFKGGNHYYREKSAGGHPAPYAYCGMELAIERLFNKCVADNKAYFMYYTGVPQST